MEYDVDFLQQVNDNVDLVEYVGQQIDLKQKGKDYFGRCPLHVDKTPSFSINSDDNYFYCFSCGKSGGIIQYLRYYEGMDFDSAVKKACELSHMDLSTMCNSATVKFLKSVRKSHIENKHIIHPLIPESELSKYPHETIKEWLDEGIRQSEIDRFDIRSDNRGNRIIIPVRDIEGNLINIKGRTRYKDYKTLGIAKYMNYYEVGNLDYFQGLDITLPYVKESGEIILFEGVKSVMKCYSWGYKNCAAAETHTITPEQLRLLIRLRVSVIFAFDSDVTYREQKLRDAINNLKKFTNVYAIDDPNKLLGGASAKNSPADCGLDVFNKLYENRRRVW